MNSIAYPVYILDYPVQIIDYPVQNLDYPIQNLDYPYPKFGLPTSYKKDNKKQFMSICARPRTLKTDPSPEENPPSLKENPPSPKENPPSLKENPPSLKENPLHLIRIQYMKQLMITGYPAPKTRIRSFCVVCTKLMICSVRV